MHQIEIWSDYVCPFCYLQEPVVDRIAREFADTFTVRWRAIELRPDPQPTLDPAGEYLTEIRSRAVYPTAAERGMTLRLPPIQTRSRRAFEATEYARATVASTTRRATRFSTRSSKTAATLVMPMSRTDRREHRHTPVWIAARFRAQRLYRPRVRDEAEAAQLGITSVPATVINVLAAQAPKRYLVSGALPYEAVRESIDRVVAAQGNCSGA